MSETDSVKCRKAAEFCRKKARLGGHSREWISCAKAWENLAEFVEAPSAALPVAQHARRI
jgi:hypothetical protein